MAARISALLSLGLLLLGPAVAEAEGLPAFETDAQADRWLREQCPGYRRLAEIVDRRGGYTIRRTAEYPGGVAYFKDGRGYIELNDALKGAHRVSVIVFELTNLYQENRHQEVAHRVRRGELNNPHAFGLMREMIEYDGLRMHRDLLVELKPALGTVPAEMITWVSSTAKTFAEYQLPYAYDYLKAQEASGHTAHYLRLFEKHRAEYLESVRRERDKEKAKEAAPASAPE
jgi:hypothetical protein